MKWIDIPPMWLLGCAVLTWLGRDMLALPSWAGTLLVVLGLALMAAAVWEMRAQRTTVIPHMAPNALISSGIFAHTRNPIYLGDALILAGLALRWDAPVGLLLVPVFMAIIQTRFIHAEEARLAAAFPDAFATYKARVRRWI